MNWIPAKLRQIRTELGLTQSKAAEASGLSQRDVSQLENGRKEGIPKEYIQFLHSRGIDLNWLFTDPAAAPEESSLLRADGAAAYAAPDLVEEARAAYGKPKAAAGPTVIRMVDEAAAALYPGRYQQPEFLAALPECLLPLPGLSPGPLRCFQVRGESMAPTLQPHDWVVAGLLPLSRAPQPYLLRADELYVVLTDEALIIKRLAYADGSTDRIRAFADNAEYPDLELPVGQVREVWQVQAYVSFRLPGPRRPGAEAAGYQQLLDRIQRLEQGRQR